MGLVNGDDTFLTEWNASILGPQGVYNSTMSCYLYVDFCSVAQS